MLSTRASSFFANELDNILSKCERDGMVSGASMMGDPRNPDDENYFVSMYNRNVLGH